LSFCCAVDGCRRRTTPPSVRYLGRRVYLGVVVVLVTAMTGGITATRAARLRAWLGVSVRTLKRWRVWWRETFVASPFWRGAQGRFMPPVASAALPASLLERFTGDERTRLLHALMFVAPVTTRRVEGRAGSAMAGGDPQTMRLVPDRRPS
jgi:predicted DNA-binding transcriptional regulator YafY